MRIRKNDQVLVIAGNYNGKKGKVLKVFPEKERIIVEGVNFIKRHTRPSQQSPQGGIVEKEASIHASSVMFVCPKCSNPSRLGTRIVFDDVRNRKNRIRYCKSCDEMLVATS